MMALETDINPCVFDRSGDFFSVQFKNSALSPEKSHWLCYHSVFWRSLSIIAPYSTGRDGPGAIGRPPLVGKHLRASFVQSAARPAGDGTPHPRGQEAGASAALTQSYQSAWTGSGPLRMVRLQSGPDRHAAAQLARPDHFYLN
jgi:hypothetical protein